MPSDMGSGAWELLDAAMSRVEIVPCPRCDGECTVGLVSLRTTCPQCAGAGISTNGANLKVPGE